MKKTIIVVTYYNKILNDALKEKNQPLVSVADRVWELCQNRFFVFYNDVASKRGAIEEIKQFLAKEEWALLMINEKTKKEDFDLLFREFKYEDGFSIFPDQLVLAGRICSATVYVLLQNEASVGFMETLGITNRLVPYCEWRKCQRKLFDTEIAQN